jgi:ubiquinone/menaquinone biosynthesis C-methylase UbiE
MMIVLRVLFGVIGFTLAAHTLIRIIRHIYKFPMPQFLANLIDNPLRRAIQPPDATAVRHGIEPGMMVLEVGPGNGRYMGNVYHLDFEGESFDLIYMIAVISEIPEPIRAMKEFYRVLKPSGRLVFSELLMDPDYPLSQTLVRWATEVNFRMTQKKGNFFYYTLIFEKEVP